jgi:flagellar protein FlaG
MDAISAQVSKPPPAPQARTDIPANSGNPAPASGKDLPPTPPPVDVQRAAEQIATYLSSSQRALQFSMDDASGRPVIIVTNPETGEIIRKIPGDEVLKMAAAMQGGNPRLLDTLA